MADDVIADTPTPEATGDGGGSINQDTGLETPSYGDDAAPPAGPESAGEAADNPPAAAPPTPDIPPYVQEMMDRVQADSQRNAQMFELLQPFMQNMARPQQGPPVDPNRIDSGEATPAEFRAYTEWQLQQQFSQMQAATQQMAQAAASEAQARGILNPQQLGQGYDYDSMRSRWLDPEYRRNPAIRELIGRAVPGNPALGEYMVAFMLEQIASHGNDPVKAFNAIRRGSQSVAAGGKQVADKIRQGEQTAARGLMQSPGAAGSQKNLGALERRMATAKTEADWDAIFRDAQEGQLH